MLIHCISGGNANNLSGESCKGVQCNAGGRSGAPEGWNWGSHSWKRLSDDPTAVSSCHVNCRCTVEAGSCLLSAWSWVKHFRKTRSCGQSLTKEMKHSGLSGKSEDKAWCVGWAQSSGWELLLQFVEANHFFLYFLVFRPIWVDWGPKISHAGIKGIKIILWELKTEFHILSWDFWPVVLIYLLRSFWQHRFGD